MFERITEQIIRHLRIKPKLIALDGYKVSLMTMQTNIMRKLGEKKEKASLNAML